MNRNRYWPKKTVKPEAVETYIESIYAFDTETEGLLGRLLFATAAEPFGNNLEFEGSPEQIVHDSVQWMLGLPKASTILIYNLGYDFRYFLVELIDRAEDQGLVVEIKPRTDTEIYGIDVVNPADKDRPSNHRPKPKLMIRDAMAVFPGGLDGFTKQFCPDLPKLEHPFDYSNKANPIHFNPNDPKHREYAIRDVESLLLAWCRFTRLLVSSFGVLPSNTAASTAMQAWLTTLPFPLDPPSSTVNEYCRQSYFGGFVWNSSINKFYNVKTYDRNSSYPAAMLDGIPFGFANFVNHYYTNLPGIYNVIVHAPNELRIPIIPMRTQGGSILWPTGTFRTTITSLEIEFAQSHGYTFEVIDGYVWPKLWNPFDQLVNRCRQIRLENKDTSLETLAKLLQNSLYGKFGTKPERVQYFQIGEDLPTENVVAVSDVEALGDDWVALTLAEPYSKQMFHWASWITASARVALLDAIYKIGVENVIYSDTDSITTSVEFPSDLINQTEYGYFKLEKVWTEFRAECPKLYAGILEDQELLGAAKGLKIKKKQMSEADKAMWAAILNRRPFVMFDLDTVPSPGVWLRTAKGLQTNQVRSVSNIANSVGRWFDEEGNVWPIKIQDELV